MLVILKNQNNNFFTLHFVSVQVMYSSDKIASNQFSHEMLLKKCVLNSVQLQPLIVCKGMFMHGYWLSYISV